MTLSTSRRRYPLLRRLFVGLTSLVIASGIVLCGCGEAYEQKEARRQRAEQRARHAEDEAARRSPTYSAWVVCTNCGKGGGLWKPSVITAKKGKPVSAVLCPYCAVWKEPPADGKPGVSTLVPAFKHSDLESAIADIVDAELDARGSSE